MHRRKANEAKDAHDSVVDGSIAGQNHTAVPMGDLPFTKTPQTRRRRKKAQGLFRSCLIRLGIRGGRTKKLDGINIHTTKRGRGGDSAFCFCVASLVFFFATSLALYQALRWMDARNAYLVIRATTNIPIGIYGALEDLRPLEYGKELPVVLFSATSTKKHSSKSKHEKRTAFQYPDELGHKQVKEAEFLDFGGIDLKLLASPDQKRVIYIMVEDLQGDARSLNQERDDDMEMYWAFDDDIERNPYNLYDTYIPEKMDGRCRRLPWHRYNLPSCNSMHELDLVTNTPRFVGDGAYREVFVTEQPYMGSIQEMIFKELRWDLDMGVDDYEYVRMDAFVTERFTSNKQITDIYGYCGLSMLTEFFPYGDIEKDVVGFQHHRRSFNPVKDKVFRQFNNFTGTEKLQLALNMVEPVAALHNYPGGVIVHDDIQLCQYLWTEEDGINVKLNDFNRAEIMLWDETDQRYCKYKNGRGHGDWRAPEEFKDLPLDEKIDVWSLGNNMYSVLTGYYPFFNVESDKKIQKLVKDGETAVIDPRFVESSFAENKLIEVIQRCFVYDPDMRADINEIWQMLKDAIGENEKYEKEEAKKNAEIEAREKEEAEALEIEKAAAYEAGAEEEQQLQNNAGMQQAQPQGREDELLAEQAAHQRAEAEEERKKAEAQGKAEKALKEHTNGENEEEVLDAQRRAKEEKRLAEEAAKKRAEAEKKLKMEEAREQASTEPKEERAHEEANQGEKEGRAIHMLHENGQGENSMEVAESEILAAQHRAKEDERIAEEVAQKRAEAEEQRKKDDAQEQVEVEKHEM